MKVVALLAALVLLPAQDTGPVFRFADPAITEASGLVDLGGLMVTANDSGGEPVLFVVDARTGETVRRTTYAESARDVEALAPGPGGTVWVGDIGDNGDDRSSVRVHLVSVRGAAPTASYELVYPGGPRNAESLFVGADGRLHVVSKGFFGGGIFAAPEELSTTRPNRLERVGSVGLLATGAAAFPGTSVVLVRGYGSVEVVDLADGREVGIVRLPEQDQGEAISVGPGDRVRITSEGRHAQVVQVAAPGWLTRRVASSRRTTAALAGASAGALGAVSPRDGG